MKRSQLVRVSDDMYKYLKKNTIKNNSNFRVESRRMFTDYKELKELGKKLKNKRVLVFGK